MLKVDITTDKDRREKSYIICPYCGKKDWFYTFWPERCPDCLKHWPVRGDEMVHNRNRRISYHLEGE
jgi:hypothetical protein